MLAGILCTLTKAVDYPIDGKKRRKKRKNETQILFNALEATLRRLVYGVELELPVAVQITTEAAATGVGLETSVNDALKQLTKTATGYADLQFRVAEIRAEIAALDAKKRRKLENDEDYWMLN